MNKSDVVQLMEAELVSNGYDPPWSLRDMLSESYTMDQSAFGDHAFSIASQAALVESFPKPVKTAGEASLINIITKT